jgi:hypothetical protein|tara:strand:- start:90 stop:458 length:369 start_codon:yes stop_codon:yes gene_type:complete
MDNLSNLELEISNINSLDNVLFIDYLNKTDNSILQERVVLNDEYYLKIYDTFIKDVPVFISDKHKQILKHINFVKINKNKETSINSLENFFSNSENATKFLKYIRTRKDTILVEKSKWTVKK